MYYFFNDKQGHVDPNKKNPPCPKHHSHSHESLAMDMEGTTSLKNMQAE
jgi:hypothetical protein